MSDDTESIQVSQRPAYFVVSLVDGREQPCIYWDELPPNHPIRNLVYVVRLDQLNPTLVKAKLADLYKVFCMLRSRNKLPPRWEPPPRKAGSGPAKLKIGHREHHPRWSLPDPPYDPQA